MNYVKLFDFIRELKSFLIELHIRIKIMTEKEYDNFLSGLDNKQKAFVIMFRNF